MSEEIKLLGLTLDNDQIAGRNIGGKTSWVKVHVHRIHRKRDIGLTNSRPHHPKKNTPKIFAGSSQKSAGISRDTSSRSQRGNSQVSFVVVVVVKSLLRKSCFKTFLLGQ